MSNYQYLMNLNVAAGRSFQDLTQYPVFPWILRDYTSNELELDNPASYRDLSLPMGSIGEKRAKQFQDRYKSLEEFYSNEVEGCPPPFYFGTHYSCSAYVLHFLQRLQPYSDYASTLQGGHFDVADRLFISIEDSWKSASEGNLQDVRELIPEFFCLPDFLVNANRFDLGTTQKGVIVDDVVLPPWAKGDSHEFIRLHRAALESKYVSDNLHSWIDLIFGYKQRGEAAAASMNLFIHLTYDGEVDVDAITDPVLKASTISQINNFGQTPSRLFNKPHPKKNSDVLHRRSNVAAYGHTRGTAGSSNDGSSIKLFETMSSASPSHYAIGDIFAAHKDKLVTLPLHCMLLGASKKFVRFDGVCNGISIHKLSISQHSIDINDSSIVVCENMHQRKVTCVAFSRNGDMLVTGSEDTAVKLWRISQSNLDKGKKGVEYVGTLASHMAGVTCIDMCDVFEIAASGSSNGQVCVWDTKMVKLIRIIEAASSVLAISIDGCSGNIAILTKSDVIIYTINGVLIVSHSFGQIDDAMNKVTRPASALVAVPVSYWHDNCIALITGHVDGQVLVWKLVTTVVNDVVVRKLCQCNLVKHHKSMITRLRITQVAVSDKEIVQKSSSNSGFLHLFIGDRDGHASAFINSSMDSSNQLAVSSNSVSSL